MSLDIYLEGQARTERCICPLCYNVHENIAQEDIFSANITHNLTTMAKAAGIYYYVWRPEEIGITHAHQLIGPLSRATGDMYIRPAYYRQFDAENGWGTLDQFLPWLKNLLVACIDNPLATIRVSR